MPVFIFILLCTVFSSHWLFATEDSAGLLTEADQIRSSDPQRFDQLLDKINISSLSAENRALFQYLLAYQSSLKGNFKKAKTRLENLSESNISDDLRIRVYTSILNINQALSNWESGLRVINQLPSQDTLQTSEESKAHLNLVIAMFYNGLGNYEAALDILTGKLQQIDNPRSDCVAKVEKLRSLEALGQHQKVLKEFPETFHRCDKVKEDIFKSISVALKAKSLNNLGQSDAALALLESEFDVANSTQYPVVIAAFHAQTAESNLTQGDIEKAKKNALKAVALADKIRNSEQLILAYKVLYEANNKQGNYKKALDYYISYTQEKQSYWNDEKTKKLAIQYAKHDAIRQKQKITLLDNENMLLKTQSELNKQRAENDRLALAIATLALFLIMLWAYRHKNAAKKLKVIAEEDALTGIANRYHFGSLANNILKRCEKNQQPVAYILFDLDNFKQVNDNYGHPIGDWALKEAVKAAVSACRSNDVIGRLGGEEFAILLPNCTIDQAQAVAEKCRRAIEEIDTSKTKHRFSITASFGITDTNRCEYSMEKLYACADAALYCSKDNGRNQIYLFNTKMPVQATI